LADFIPEEIIAQVRNAANIVDVISEYVMLKRTGKNFVGICPFHTDNKPSFTVSEEKQIYHCFGCAQGGNVFSFLMQYSNLSFPETAGEEFQEKERLLRVNSQAAEHFKKTLETPGSGKRARDFLDKRQMSPEIIDRFLLGYAPKSWTNIIQYFSRQGTPAEDLEKAGLVVANKGRHYDRFRDRIIFPILDVHEKVVGFGGRCLDDSLPKYLNSPDTPVYHKSKTLYGLHAAKEACRRSGSAFIVEGYFDLLALQCRGIQNVVATLGTALTQQHVRIMKGYAKQMTLVFDSDEAGIKAAKRSLTVFMEEKVDARILVLPEGMDPDSYVQEVGADGFINAAESAEAAMPFLVTSAIQKHGLSLDGKVRVVEILKGPLGSLADSVSRSVYIRDLAERLDIDESAILEQVRASVPTRDDRVPLAKKKHGGSRLEEALVAIMIKNPTILSSLNLEEIVSGIESAELRRLADMIVKRFNAKEPVTGADLIAESDDPLMSNIVSSLLMEDMEEDNDSCWKIVKQYQAHQRKQQIKKLSRKIKKAEEANNQELLSQLLAEKQKWAQQQLEAL
jgi:DNA primase